MPRYTFSLSKAHAAAESGTVLSDSFTEALDAIAEQPRVSVGDTLEIGVPGFPPARYECVAFGRGQRKWKPANLLAA
jgi:protein involved in polysaccharide export with SLBB domain